MALQIETQWIFKPIISAGSNSEFYDSYVQWLGHTRNPSKKFSRHECTMTEQPYFQARLLYEILAQSSTCDHTGIRMVFLRFGFYIRRAFCPHLKWSMRSSIHRDGRVSDCATLPSNRSKMDVWLATRNIQVNGSMIRFLLRFVNDCETLPSSLGRSSGK